MVSIIPFEFSDTIFQALVGFFIEDYLCFYVCPPGVKLMTFLLLYQLRISGRLEEKLYDYLLTNSVCVAFSFGKQSQAQVMFLSHFLSKRQSILCFRTISIIILILLNEFIFLASRTADVNVCVILNQTLH